MATRKSDKNKSSARKNDDAVDVKVEDLMPQRAKVSFTCRLLILASAIGIGLLVYDKVEPGQIPFFKNEQKACANPIHDIADNVNESLAAFAAQLNSAISTKKEAPKINLDEIVGNINNSKNEILDSITVYLEKFKDIEVSNGEQQVDKINKVIVETKQAAEDASKNNILIELAYDKISSVINKKEVTVKDKSQFRSQLSKLKSEILKPVKVAAVEKEKTEEKIGISSQIKNALGSFVKLRKVDDKKVMLEQLFIEAEDALKQSDYATLNTLLIDIADISENKKADALALKAIDLQGSTSLNIKSDLQEILDLIEKLRTNTN
jgi:predicted Zn-dependent protease with MMP-like domain